MKTERAPTTALRGKNISEDALAKSMAIFAAPYAVSQPDPLDDPGTDAMGGGVFFGPADDEGFFFRKRGIADATTKCIKGILPLRCWILWSETLGPALMHSTHS